MERIYFDKQIFSHLFKQEKLVYKGFLAQLLENKNRFLFCYSNAHLLDLKNDKTDIKYQELDFIEKLVDDNYLSYHPTDKRTSCYLVKPLEAFKDIEANSELISFATLFDELDLNSETEEQKQRIAFIIKFLSNQKIDFAFSQIQNLPEEFKKGLPIDLNSIPLIEWAEHLMGTLKLMEEDKNIYKGLRNVVDKNINNGKYTVDYDSIDFNDDLKNSVLQKSFIEYVNNNLNPNGNKEVSDYDFYTHAYVTLDLLGISKESPKTIKFRNLLNDGFHSYYGAFCDYIVSDDNGFLKKTQAMYKLLNIETKVFNINDFIKHFNLLSNSSETNANTFFSLLIKDIKNGLVVSREKSLQFNRTTTVIKPFHSYFGYFNRIDSMKEDDKDYILLRRKTNNYSCFSFYREYEGLVNNAFKLFGYDIDSKGEFVWDKEIQEIQTKKWEGRFWHLGAVTLHLEINKGIQEICLLITPICNEL